MSKSNLLNENILQIVLELGLEKISIDNSEHYLIKNIK